MLGATDDSVYVLIRVCTVQAIRPSNLEMAVYRTTVYASNAVAAPNPQIYGVRRPA